MHPRLQRGLHYLGTALALLGIAFVAQRLYSQGISVDTDRLGPQTYWWVAASAVVYGASNLMLGMAWWHLLLGLQAQRPRSWALRTYSMSQLAKYVPGNVAQLLSRQAIGMSSGVSGWTLARSSVWELGLLCLAGGALAVLALPMHFPGAGSFIGIAACVACIFVVCAVLRAAANAHFAFAFLWQVAFLGLAGITFALLFGMVAPTAAQALPWMGVLGAFVGAWLVGMVTPGAPAGLGVRELAFLALAPLGTDQANGLLALLLMRLITLGGDFLVFIAASTARSRQR